MAKGKEPWVEKKITRKDGRKRINAGGKMGKKERKGRTMVDDLDSYGQQPQLTIVNL